MEYNDIYVGGINLLSPYKIGSNGPTQEIDQVKTGLELLIREIREIAMIVFSSDKNDSDIIKKGCPIKNIFIEYSSVALMMSDDKMIGFGALDTSNDQEFNDNVKYYAFNVIGALQKQGLTIYAHPDFISSYSKRNNVVGLSFRSWNDYDVSDVLKSLHLSMDVIGSGFDKSSIKKSLYWSGIYSYTYEQLLKDIAAFKKKFEDRIPPIEDLFTVFKECYDIAFGQIEKRERENSCYVGVPILGAKAGDMPIAGQGAAFIYFTYDKVGVTSEKIEEFIRLLGLRVDYILKAFLFNLLAYSALNLREKTRKESIKSAVSAIMSRNMSHNLGSHCMHYTRATLEGLAEKMCGHGPEIRGAARLMGYIQARMDFLATLVSGEEYPYGAVNFKSQVFDVLTIDDFSKRHYESSSLSNKYTTIRDSGVKSASANLVDSLDRIVREDAENVVSFMKDVVKATQDLMRTLDELPYDNANRRTSNFLLENLIKSEHFSRDSIRGDVAITGKKFYLYVRYNGKLFTGAAYDKDRISDKISKAQRKGNLQEVARLNALLSEAEREDEVKADLSNLSIAMPGGIMSSHALFNIIENLIRNSAKHRASDLKGNSLITTIDIQTKIIKNKETDINYPMYQITIYDNKENADIVYPLIQKQLKELRVLEPDSSINKKSKGLKEMLVSALWLKSNETKYNYSDLLSKIEQQEDVERKIEMINDYAFEIVRVDKNGLDVEENAPAANFGIRIYLPSFERRTRFVIDDIANSDCTDDIVQSIKNRLICADIIEINNPKYYSVAKKIFPRFITAEEQPTIQEINTLCASVQESLESAKDVFKDTVKFYSILKKRFGIEATKSKIVFDEGASQGNNDEKARMIYFRRHFNKGDDFSSGMDYLYADSVSGGNFTVTLHDNYLKGISNGQYLGWKDKYFALKIIESALTRITIIDERLSDSADGEGLTMKNIRVMNLDPTAKDEMKAWSGNDFKDKSDRTLFLSIHLGLIEKVIGNDKNWFTTQYSKYEESTPEKQRVDRAVFFMNCLKKKFGQGGEIFISIHSGRGNYSYELEHSLKEYPFINLSAIESVFSNSKYLLTQLFYNTTYIGKGEYNKKDK